MNIFEIYLAKIKLVITANKEELEIKDLNNLTNIVIENPPSNFDFHLSCNVSLILAKNNKINPKNLASKIKELLLKKIDDFELIEIASPGFINIKLKKNILEHLMKKIYLDNNSYGSSKSNKKFNIEFVSANPTGPMHVGHCRGAIYGDVLSNLLIFNGNTVTKEYYINDYGNQIKNFVKSVYLRIREIRFKEVFTNKEDLYPGNYVVEMAKKIIEDNKDLDFKEFDKFENLLIKESLKHTMNMIKSDLLGLGIKHDIFFSETEIVKKDLVNKTIAYLKENKFVVNGFLAPPKGDDSKNWKKTKRLIFKSTLFGDDTDRALQKNDGSWTYFANDVAYHSDKVSRKYDFLINVLGADHTGYIKRITSAVKALSKNKVSLECKVCQLVKLYKNGKPFKMSKRAGDFISAKDLLNEVNKDSIRFMMLNRSNDVELDFDFDKVLEKSKDNPVYYVQYCYARINSIFRTLEIKDNEELTFDKEKNFNEYEDKILRKIFDWPKVIDSASKKYEPHRIPFYLYEISSLFHTYWSKGNDNDHFKFIKEGKINNLNTISVIKLINIVINNGMNILGVSLPKKM